MFRMLSVAAIASMISCSASQGPKGDTGPQGPTGPRGADGAPGMKGDIGLPGVAGRGFSKADVYERGGAPQFRFDGGNLAVEVRVSCDDPDDVAYYSSCNPRFGGAGGSAGPSGEEPRLISEGLFEDLDGGRDFVQCIWASDHDVFNPRVTIRCVRADGGQ